MRIRSERQFDVVYDTPLEPFPVMAFEEFEMADAAMKRLASRAPGKYFVWSSEEGKVLAHLATCTTPDVFSDAIDVSKTVNTDPDEKFREAV